MKSLPSNFENVNYDTAPVLPNGFKHSLVLVKQSIRNWKQNADTRFALGQLSYQALDDIAVSRADALAESAKPFWRN